MTIQESPWYGSLLSYLVCVTWVVLKTLLINQDIDYLYYINANFFHSVWISSSKFLILTNIVSNQIKMHFCLTVIWSKLEILFILLQKLLFSARANFNPSANLTGCRSLLIQVQPKFETASANYTAI